MEYINGKNLQKKFLNELKQTVSLLGIKPTLAVISIDNNKIKDNINVKDNAVDVKVKNTTEEATNNANKEVVLNNVSNALNTYVTYHIHILNDGEDINTIINKYKVTKELIDEYNSGLEWVMGEKVIIPDLQDDQLE